MSDGKTAKLAHYPLVDMVRGAAIVLMIAYHFTFDLDYFGLLDINFSTDPFWLSFRASIVSLFLTVVGVSLFLATRHGIQWPAYFRRMALLSASAALVSLASMVLFPRSWIFFGVLHFIAVASVLGLAFTRFFLANLVLGTALIGLGLAFSHPLFDQPALQWLGLMTHKPTTEDYMPLLPWFGVVLLGIFLGRLLYGRAPVPAFAARPCRNGLEQALAFGGRHSLLIYMLHQPLLFGAFFLFV